MAVDEMEKTEKNILYELLVLSEWVQDFDSGLPKTTLNTQESSGYFSPWKYFKKPKFDNKRFLQNEYPRHLAVSHDGRVLAVLQESLLEIRTAKDEFSSVKGRASLPLDQCPQLRKLMWSPDNLVLAVARDNGIVNLYNLLGSNIATIQPGENTSSEIYPVVGLLFLQTKFKSTKWTNELLIIYRDGKVKSVLLAALDSYEPEENIQFTLEAYYPEGVTAVAYHASHHILLVAGFCPTNTHGITVWRILNDYPYLKIAIDSIKSSNSPRSLFRFLPGFSPQNNPSTISKMRISPNGDFLACLHFSGDISLWRLPGIWLHKRWPLVEQPQHHMVHPQAYESVKGEHYFYPVDVSWWSDSALAVARRSGAVSVCSIFTLENLLGDSPEFLAGPPRISSVHGERSGVIALECEITCNFRNRLRIDDSDIGTESDSEASVLQASIQAALYSITDIEKFEPKRKTPRVIQRTYRLVALKRTTPEELYSRKIDNEDYEEALALAYTYNLDRDLVYQRQWRASNVSVQSIYNYLDKVSKIFWVANECVERVPDTAEAARELLQFGLKKTEIDEKSRQEGLNSDQRCLLKYRKQLFLFLDNLTIYEKIIGSPDKYNSTDYDDFRRKHPIVATVNFARQENWQAVSLMFTFRGNETLPHWLPILSNFPETLMPLQYRSLLPELIGGEVVPWEVKKIRYSDWSEKEPFEESQNDKDVSNECIYEFDPSLRQFQTSELTGNIVEEWYRRRTYEIEENTGLVDNALNFVKLARERNVKNLDQLYFDLMTLESLVYSVQDDSISLVKLETMSHLDQAKLLISKTDNFRFIKDLKDLIVPFANRCEKKGCDTLYSLLRGLLLEFSERSLELPLSLLKHLKENEASPLKLNVIQRISLALDCLYSCLRINELENCFSILECLPERENCADDEEMKLHDRIDKLEFHLEMCEILHRYNCPKSVKYVFENEDNEEVAKQLMKEMAEYTKNESLDFTELLSDLKYIQSKVFNCVETNFCYELFALTQMSCECEEIIQSAEEILQCRKSEPGKLIPFERSVELVLKAARAHFEKATSFDDASIKLSQTCLRLINEPHPEINEELDLIESVQLLGDFDVKLLPLQVRKCTDRLKLIESCLISKKGAYKSSQRLLQLAHTLRICGEDRMKREGQVLTIIAEYALKSSDYNCCSEICNRLVTRNYSPAWTTVCLLAKKEDFENTTIKKFLLAFAILHCPIENIEELIEARIKLNPIVFPNTKGSSNKENIYISNNENDSIR